MLETICIALYGEGFPSRTNKSYTASLICQEKPKSEKASTSIIVNIGNDFYKINRTFSISATDAAKLVANSKEITIDRKDGDEYINLYSGKTAVDTWINTYIGNIRSFLTSCMITQHSDCDFFSLKPNDQKEMLDQSLDIESCTYFQNILKESKLAHYSIKEFIQNKIDCIKFTETKYKTVESVEWLISDTTDIINNKKEQYENIIRKLPEYFDYIETNQTQEYIDESEIQLLRQNICNILNISSFDEIDNEIEKLKVSSDVKDSLKNGSLLSKQDILTEISCINKQGVIQSCDYVDDLDELIKLYNDFEYKNIVISDINQKYKEIKNKYGSNISSNLLQNKIEILSDNKPEKPTESYELALKIYSGEKPSKQYSTKTKEEIKDILQSLSKRLVNYMMNQPTKNETKVTKSKEMLLKETENKCEIKDINKLINHVNSLEKLQYKYKIAKETYEELKSNIDSFSNIPYNSTCWACNKQPWKAQSDSYKTRLISVEDTMGKLEEKIKKHDNVDTFDDCILGFKTYIDNLNQLESLAWNEYISMIDEVNKEIKENEDIYNWLSWKEAKKTVNKWDEFNIWENESNCLKDELMILKQIESIKLNEQILSKKLYLLENDLNQIVHIENKNKYAKVCVLYDKLKLLENKLNLYYSSLKIESNDILKEIKNQEKLLLELQIEKRMILENNIKKEEIKSLTDYYHSLNNKYQLLENIYNTFSGFKEWVYTNKVIPYLTSFANNIISNLTDNRPIQLVGRMNDGNPSWYINDINLSPIEKASGFQKFVLGLSIRIALSKFGTTGMLTTQLFIDEGFTACDSENIARIPKFLNNLLTLFTNGIVLVSHLDDIKLCAKLNFNLNRNILESTTLCQYGHKIHL